MTEEQQEALDRIRDNVDKHIPITRERVLPFSIAMAARAICLGIDELVKAVRETTGERYQSDPTMQVEGLLRVQFCEKCDVFFSGTKGLCTRCVEKETAGKP